MEDEKCRTFLVINRNLEPSEERTIKCTGCLYSSVVFKDFLINTSSTCFRRAELGYRVHVRTSAIAAHRGRLRAAGAVQTNQPPPNAGSEAAPPPPRKQHSCCDRTARHGTAARVCRRRVPLGSTLGLSSLAETPAE